MLSGGPLAQPLLIHPGDPFRQGVVPRCIRRQSEYHSVIPGRWSRALILERTSERMFQHPVPISLPCRCTKFVVKDWPWRFVLLRWTIGWFHPTPSGHDRYPMLSADNTTVGNNARKLAGNSAPVGAFSATLIICLRQNHYNANVRNTQR